MPSDTDPTRPTPEASTPDPASITQGFYLYRATRNGEEFITGAQVVEDGVDESGYAEMCLLYDMDSYPAANLIERLEEPGPFEHQRPTEPGVYWCEDTEGAIDLVTYRHVLSAERAIDEGGIVKVGPRVWPKPDASYPSPISPDIRSAAGLTRKQWKACRFWYYLLPGTKIWFPCDSSAGEGTILEDIAWNALKTTPDVMVYPSVDGQPWRPAPWPTVDGGGEG